MAHRVDSNSSDDTLTNILSDDEAVDEMPEERVKEAYVKMKLFQVAHESYLEPKYGHDSMNNDEYVRLLKFLEDWGPQGVQMALQVFRGEAYATDFVAQCNQRTMGENEAHQVIDDFFNIITNTDMTEAQRIEAVRGKLKITLRSCGMPRSKIARATVQDWKAEKAQMDGN